MTTAPAAPADPQAEQRRRDAELLALLLLLGSSLAWTDRDLIALAAVTPATIQRATGLWRTLMPPLSRNLLAAGQWSPGAQAYVLPGGPLAPAEMKSLSLAFSSAVADRLETETEPLASGERTIEDWQQTAGGIVKAAVTAQTVFAAGGVDQLQPRDVQAAANETRGQLKYLQNFARQLELKDARAGTAAVVLARVRQYAAAANKSYEATRRVSHRRAVDGKGLLIFTDERNVLAPAEHCSTEGGIVGCLEETRRGWVRIGTLSAPGDRRCGVSCKCRLEFRRRA